MIYTKESFLKEIESKLLPKGAAFSEQQKSVILLNNTANIVAGPGSGKTTVLTAKCAMLLHGNIGNSKGICLITHTNVAVDEIKSGLSKVGFNSIEYPNFIGTIQEFFNYFFGKKAFHIIFGDKNIRILDDDEYRERFDYYFDRLKPSWYTSKNPNVKGKNPQLIINQDLTYDVISDANSTYRDAFNNSIKSLLELGIITNKQCLELSAWYINKHLLKIRSSLFNRFEYILLDEAQDTNEFQYELLNSLFLNNVKFQRFGDPYQALYTIFDTEEDAWIPTEEAIDINKNEITETSRFNENIANLVKNVCIEKYDSFSSISSVDSFPPYFITYDNGLDLKLKYEELITTLEEESLEYKNSNKKDAILSAKHDDLANLFEDYIRSNSKVRRSESVIKQIYSLILRMIAKELDLNFQQTEEKLNSSLDNKSSVAKLIKDLVTKDDIESTITNVIQEIEKIKNDIIEPQNKEKIKDQLSSFIKEMQSTSKNINVEQNDAEFYIGTVHSVKGETHRSTLLVLNTVFSDWNETFRYEIFELLYDYLIGSYQELENINDLDLKRETKNALKLAYVAFSRPTHLVAIGIHSEMLTEEFKQELIEYGWKEWGNEL
ncbi:UvrD-helicase domain-containing protein [Lysinibacillus telephonicus]|uniref:ATP-dependent helicase n=1 Tax=Lysinibacillus telephonicus TaxID=1714840 RepID=A0A431US28_9BACI|nr:UvrD-helicase domain-containing protein [Lysinibacillus telephonicus]RTQ92241.1 ATP-dependent helicase [Lysinibacillus telephonicus]